MKLHSSRSHPALALLLAGGLVAGIDLSTPPPASACGNAVNPVIHRQIREVAAAEKALGSGQAAAAVLAALTAYPRLHANDGLMGEAPHWDARAVRAQRIVAVAVVRSEGLLTVGADFHASTVDERRAHLEWSIGILRAVANLTGAPDARTDLGEALSKLPETRDEALALLERLDADDLVTSAQAYAALADLREARGDLAGRDTAMLRFRQRKPSG